MRKRGWLVMLVLGIVAVVGLLGLSTRGTSLAAGPCVIHARPDYGAPGAPIHFTGHGFKPNEIVTMTTPYEMWFFGTGKARKNGTFSKVLPVPTTDSSSNHNLAIAEGSLGSVCVTPFYFTSPTPTPTFTSAPTSTPTPTA